MRIKEPVNKSKFYTQQTYEPMMSIKIQPFKAQGHIVQSKSYEDVEIIVDSDLQGNNISDTNDRKQCTTIPSIINSN